MRACRLTSQAHTLWYRLRSLGQICTRGVNEKEADDDDCYAAGGVTNTCCWLNKRRSFLLSHEKYLGGFQAYMGAVHSY